MNKYMRKIREYVKGSAGLTLVELVIVIAVMGIIILATTPFFKMHVKSYVSVSEGKDLMQSARIGFNRMIVEMRMIEAAIEIDEGHSHKIQFDLPHQNNINYTFESGQLKREGIKLIHGVQSFVIRYYRADGTLKNTPFSYDSDVWRIEVEMEVGDGEDNLVLHRQVTPRNIHYN